MSKKSINPRLLPTLLRPFAKKISMFDDERNVDNGFFVVLVDGWRDSGDFIHQFHEDTLPALVNLLKSIEPCDCKDCSDSLQKS